MNNIVEQRIKQAIEDLKHGKMIIMIDDEDRENEGDLVYASTFSTPEHVNFMASYAKGLICVAISPELATHFELNPMVSSNNSSYETAFTVSVDAASCTTGISAYERDDTIKLLSSFSSSPTDLVRPGHIFPLIAKDGGTLVRTGHTEGAVDICTMAGLSKSGVICEIMKDDGTMARRDDLDIFAKKHDLNTVYISDIVEYRLKNESLVTKISTKADTFMGYETKKIEFNDHHGNIHRAYIFGDIDNTTNIKFHNIGDDYDLLCNKQKFDSLINSIEYLSKNNGILVFLGKEIYTNNVQMKDYGVGAQIVKKLGVSNINLLVKKAGTEFIGISGFGLHIDEEIIL
ncbi:MAG: 3,4-dihydroxy-2-butanone 4-phosphate synthase (EC / GTP cyclohydrolase II (EC [uncultured Campylobacterales bacterium]|uniref:3,4-dihydroxy-2-butanone 4-phosphate synthase n=1 Tax=uncultured Campylobacterales bacterium TaxID=352960 RepID=A0A6S6S9J1_9BACT|nr:MAG: 3,4-dihydroxy-2-butanone 4-phosphate synthase (EC / GTP cyclohydrolase II (EC [uncultured Campylobacterales bacterium]